MAGWKTIDIAALLKNEAAGGMGTTSVNAGGYVVPIGQVMTRYPVGAQDQYTRKRQDDEEGHYGGYESYEDWMLPGR